MNGGQVLLKQFQKQPDNPFYQERMAEAPPQEHPLYWDAFWELLEESYGEMGRTPIKRSMAREWAFAFGFNANEVGAFVDIIKALDYVHSELENGKKK